MGNIITPCGYWILLKQIFKAGRNNKKQIKKQRKTAYTKKSIKNIDEWLQYYCNYDIIKGYKLI
jgi:hypothetical protein